MRLDAVINERLAVVVVNLSLSAAQCQSVTAENLLMKCYAKRPGGHQGDSLFWRASVSLNHDPAGQC